MQITKEVMELASYTVREMSRMIWLFIGHGMPEHDLGTG